MSRRFAAIGSRDLTKVPEEGIQLYEAVCRYYGSQNWVCRTGAAKDADQTAAELTSEAGGKVWLCLPWYNYEKMWWQELCRQYPKMVKVDSDNPLDDPKAEAAISLHDNPAALKLGDRKLMARNYRIMDSDGILVEFAIALPRPPAVGGTKHGIKVCSELGIPCFNLSIDSGRKLFISSEFCTPEILDEWNDFMANKSSLFARGGD